MANRYKTLYVAGRFVAEHVARSGSDDGRPGGSMCRSNRKRIVNRLAKLMVMCQRYRYLPRLNELGVQLLVHPRTIRRDLEALEEAGIIVPQRLDQREDVA